MVWTKFSEICLKIKKQIEKIADTKKAEAEAGLGTTYKYTFEDEVIESANSNNRNMLRLLVEGTTDDDDVYNYLLGVTTRDTHGKYKGKIDSDFMAAKVLGDFLRTITSNLGKNDCVFDSVYLFVDECEILFDAKATESDPVFSGLRELIDGVPYGLGLVLSFSAATALIEAYMPQHLLKRMTYDFIEVPMLEDKQAVEFLKEHLNWFRLDNYPINKNPFYPFELEAIEYVVHNQTSLTPRNLFKDCRRILERSIRIHKLSSRR